MASGEISLSEVWKMLEACLPGHVRKLHTHHYSVRLRDRIYPAFPKGAHGKADPSIEKGHVRRLARFFGIMDCAKQHLNV